MPSVQKDHTVAQVQNSKKIAAAASACMGKQKWQQRNAELGLLIATKHIKDPYTVYLRETYLPARLPALTKQASKVRKSSLARPQASQAPVYGGSQEVFRFLLLSMTMDKRVMDKSSVELRPC
jgi:hypothetical protein